MIKVKFEGEKSFLKIDSLNLENLLKAVQLKCGQGEPIFSSDEIIINYEDIIEFITQFQNDIQFCLNIDVNKGKSKRPF